MDIFEVEQKETREPEGGRDPPPEARQHAGRQRRHKVRAGGMHFNVHVPDEVQLKVELEVESDKRELEIELTW